MDLILSNLPKTWIIDVDGTIFEHNSYLYGKDILLDGAIELFSQIRDDDYVILLSARKKEHEELTKKSLLEYGLRYDLILFDIPIGERILINDKKDSGLKTAFAINVKRNNLGNINILIDEEL